MTTNLWVFQEWRDPFLVWDPSVYGGVQMIYVPVSHIWQPDIVLYNTADGRYEMTEGTKVTVFHTGKVQWRPPASLKSSCDIDATYFPFDQQKCNLEFGSWSYNIHEVDIVHMWENSSVDPDYIKVGFDMRNFYQSVEWDLLDIPALKDTLYYAGSLHLFARWKFQLRLRRKFLFYTVNLIVPLISHAFITVLSFYLPSSSRKKITLVINILLSLTVFFLMLEEIIPPASIIIPLLGKYLIFTLILVVTSVMITTVCFNVHFRSSATHTMPNWTRKIFLYWMPKILMMKRPKVENSHDVQLKYIKLKLCSCFERPGSTSCLERQEASAANNYVFSAEGSPRYQFGSKRTRTQTELMKLSRELEEVGGGSGEHSNLQPDVARAVQGAIYIAQVLKKEDAANRIKEDWKYIALVIDRLFLWIYVAICVFGTFGIFCQAPAVFDREPALVFSNNSTHPGT